jgi:hypothetical protein
LYATINVARYFGFKSLLTISVLPISILPLGPHRNNKTNEFNSYAMFVGKFLQLTTISMLIMGYLFFIAKAILLTSITSTSYTFSVLLF